MQVQEATLTLACGVLCMLSGACMLLHAPTKTSHRRIVKALGWVGWASRLAYSVYLACMLHVPAEWAAPNKIGSAHLALMYNALLDQMSSLHDLPLWLNTSLRFLHGLAVSAQFARYFEVFPSKQWWRLLWRHMLVWALPQVSLLVPYQILCRKANSKSHVKGSEHQSPASLTAPPEGPTVKQTCAEGSDAVDQQAPTNKQLHSDSAVGQAVRPVASQFANAGGRDCCTTNMLPAATGNKDNMAAVTTTGRSLHRSGRQLPPHLHGTCQAPRSSLDHVQDMMRMLQHVPYQSKLGMKHKACLKLRTDATCEALPPNLTQALNEALQNIQGPKLQITEVAIRPGCVMITLGLVETPHTPRTADQRLANQVAAALLSATSHLMQQQAQQDACIAAVQRDADGGQHTMRDKSVTAVHGAFVQVDDLFFELPDANSCWQLQPAAECLPATLGESPTAAAWQAVEDEHVATARSSSSVTSMGIGSSSRTTSSSGNASGSGPASPPAQPWLGISRIVGMHPTGTSADIASPTSPTAATTLERSSSATSSVDGDDLWDLYLECQVWQLPDKLTTVQGWAPTPHQVFPEHMTSAGGALQLLVRSTASGGYLATEVLHMDHGAAGDGPRCATATVRVLAASHALFQHHPGSGPSSVMLLNTELWQEHALLSSSPLLAAPAADHTRDATTTAERSTTRSLHNTMGVQPASWWWGASNNAVAGAVTELTANNDALASADRAALAASLPAYKEFMKDLGLWLRLVQSEAVRTCHCTSAYRPVAGAAAAPSAAGMKHKGASNPAAYADTLVHVPGHASVADMQTPAKHVLAGSSSDLMVDPSSLTTATEGYAHHIQQAPALPLRLQQVLAQTLLEYTAAIGMHGVNRMVSEQQQLLQKLQHKHAQSPVCSSRSRSGVLGVLPAWLTLAQLREVICGHTCDLCEMRYKHGLHKVVANSRVMMSIAAAMLSTSAAARAVAERDWSFALCNVPWAAIHVSLTALCFWVAVRSTTSPQRTAATSAAAAAGASAAWDAVPMRGYLFWVVVAWAYRVACTWSLALKGMLWQQPAVVGNFMFGNLAAWCFAVTINGFSEQLQATALLPASRVAQIVLGLDLPAALAWSGQELWGPAAALVPAHTWAVAAFVRFVVAPLLVLLPRLVTDASLRHHLLHTQRTHKLRSRPASKAAAMPDSIAAARPRDSTSMFTSGGSGSSALVVDGKLSAAGPAGSDKAPRAKQE